MSVLGQLYESSMARKQCEARVQRQIHGKQNGIQHWSAIRSDEERDLTSDWRHADDHSVTLRGVWAEVLSGRLSQAGTNTILV
jgi:hypothetical protein